MLIKSEIDVAKSPDQVWEFFNDIPLVASCLPGADISEQVGDDSYVGSVVIKTGPVKLEFTGEATITERDDAGRRLVVEASGADIKGRGQASLVIHAVIIPNGGACYFEHLTVFDARRTSGLTRTTSETEKRLLSQRLLFLQTPFGDPPHEVDTPAR